MSATSPKIFGTPINKEGLTTALSEMHAVMYGFETMLAISPRHKRDGETVLQITPQELLRILDLLRRTWATFEKVVADVHAVSHLNEQQVEFSPVTDDAEALSWEVYNKRTAGTYTFSDNMEDHRRSMKAVFELLKEKNAI